MLSYTVRRVAQMVPVIVGATFLIFLLVFALPGDPIAALAGDQPLAPATIASLRAEYHLDDPLLVQYGHYVWGLIHGDLGVDFYGRPVSELIATRWPVTLQLAVTAWLLKIFMGVLVGVYSGLRHGRAGDHFALFFTVLFLGVPSFVLALWGQLTVGVELGWVPVAGTTAGWPMAFILPALVIALEGAASLGRLTRTSLVSVLRSEYLRTARAKGLSPSRVIWGHAFRNAMIPVITYLGLSLAAMLGGAIIIEAVFNIPGIGGLLAESLVRQDGTVVVGIASLLVVVYLVFNLIVDLLYGVIDPRIRLD